MTVDGGNSSFFGGNNVFCCASIGEPVGNLVSANSRVPDSPYLVDFIWFGFDNLFKGVNNILVFLNFVSVT